MVSVSINRTGSGRAISRTAVFRLGRMLRSIFYHTQIAVDGLLRRKYPGALDPFRYSDVPPTTTAAVTHWPTLSLRYRYTTSPVSGSSVRVVATALTFTLRETMECKLALKDSTHHFQATATQPNLRPGRELSTSETRSAVVISVLVRIQNPALLQASLIRAYISSPEIELLHNKYENV